MGKADCLRDDPEMKEERSKSQVKLLREELKLQKEVNDEAQQRAELAYLEAKKISSQYQKEAEKCNMVCYRKPPMHLVLAKSIEVKFEEFQDALSQYGPLRQQSKWLCPKSLAG